MTLESVLAGLYEGMRLATILICVGAANSLANPKRLLKSMPPALYEIGTAIVVAVALLPQLADSLRRVRAARQLAWRPRRSHRPAARDRRTRDGGRARAVDVAGGRHGLPRLRPGRGGRAAQRRTTGALMIAGLVGICVGIYALLDQTAPQWLAVPGLLGGVALAAGGFWSAGRRVRRTRYRPDHWGPAELGGRDQRARGGGRGAGRAAR